jgi:hypothetical protein
MQVNWVVAVLVAVGGCGGAADKDAGMDATTDTTVANDVGSHDSGWLDDVGMSKYIDVDGGRDCGIDASGKGQTGQTWTCCNDAVCAGRCVTEPDSGKKPFCWCAGVVGGCPSMLTCCVDLVFPDGWCDMSCPSLGGAN